MSGGYAYWRTARTEKGVPLATQFGERASYIIAQYEGLYGTRKETSWNREKHQHDCCGAKVSWRHKIDCPVVLERKSKSVN